MTNVRVVRLRADVFCAKNYTVEDYGWKRSYYFVSSYGANLLVCDRIVACQVPFGTRINVAVKVKYTENRGFILQAGSIRNLYSAAKIVVDGTST